jgi:hypothetical protein
MDPVYTKRKVPLEREEIFTSSFQEERNRVVLQKGTVHFFAQGREVVEYRKNRAGESESMKAKKNKWQPSRADTTGERGTTRRAGDDAMAQRAPQSDVDRDRSGGG